MHKIWTKFNKIEDEPLLYQKMQNLLRNLNLHKVILHLLDLDVAFDYVKLSLNSCLQRKMAKNLTLQK
jgi:hypothetical protein